MTMTPILRLAAVAAIAVFAGMGSAQAGPASNLGTGNGAHAAAGSGNAVVPVHYDRRWRYHRHIRWHQHRWGWHRHYWRGPHRHGYRGHGRRGHYHNYRTPQFRFGVRW